MTREELVSYLETQRQHGDIEAGHSNADDALCEFLRSLGYDDVIDAYEKIGKWYS